MKRRIRFAASLWLALGATSVQAAVPCVSEPAAEALMTTLLPDVLNAAGTVCAANLPPEAMLRRGLPGLVARYRAEAPAAWPQASGALAKLIGDQMNGIDPNLIRPLITALITPLLAKEIRPVDCPRVDRIVTLLSPLPARSTAAIVVMLVTLETEGKPGKLPFRICPLAPPQ